MEKDHTTNEELVELIKNGFDHVSEGFALVRGEISSLRTEFKSDLKSEISSLRTELKAEISAVRTELKNEISSEISSVRTEISSLRTEMQEGFLKINDKVDLLTVKL